MPVFAVTTAKGANWDHARDIRHQPFFAEHAAFADGLVDRGIILLGGPVTSEDDEDIALLAVEAPDESTLRSIFDADPWTVHRVFGIKAVRAWTLWLDGRSRLSSATPWRRDGTGFGASRALDDPMNVFNSLQHGSCGGRLGMQTSDQ